MKKASSIVGSLMLAGTSLGLVMTGATAAEAATTQTYSCSTPIGALSGTATVVGKATLNSTTKTISLSGVKLSVNDSFGTSVTGNHLKVTIPDPNKTSAPYKAGTAKVASTPAGWTAGHATSGIFAAHAGSVTVNNGQSFSNAALSAKYADKGPAGTVISFHPGTFSFTMTSPLSGPVTCTPTAPIVNFASVTE